MKSFVIFSCQFAILAIVAAKVAVPNSCSIDCGGQPHVACGYTGKFDKTNCYDGTGKLVARLVPMTPELQNLAVDLHNRERNKVAGGTVANHPHACNMATMSWDEGLAYNAEANVMKCISAHDKCRNTLAFQHAGQNIFTKFRSNDNFNYKDEITRAVESWMEEAQYSNRKAINSYPQGGSKIGHFTVISRDNNPSLGCAAVVVFDGKWHKFIFVCNYATTNIIDARVYHWDCASPAAGCKSGKNTKYSNLCSPKEQVDPNSYVKVKN